MNKQAKDLEKRVTSCKNAKYTTYNINGYCSLNPSMQTMYKQTTCPYLHYQPTICNEGIYVCDKEKQ